jgi:phytoene dehydrogenase-like protein
VGTAAASSIASSPSTLLTVSLLREAAKLLARFGRLGTDLPRFFEFLLSPASKVLPKAAQSVTAAFATQPRKRLLQVLDSWFDSDILKTTLATDAIVGAMVAPSSPQSA